LPRLIIRSSDIHAAGCFALEDIPKGTRVLEYTGERISKAEGDDVRTPIYLASAMAKW
jgi:SET domain-containing protein